MHAHCRITGHSEVETIYSQLPHSRQISRNDPTEGIQQAHIYGFPVIGLVIGTKIPSQKIAVPVNQNWLLSCHKAERTPGRGST
jgi:hypothetical protein